MNEICPSCSAPALRTELEIERFPYGEESKRITLEAQVPVLVCGACGSSFTGIDAEAARHEAVCRHLGLMTPREMLELRNQLGLSLRELSELSGLGKASLWRWEQGDGVPNSANDNLLYLLKIPANVTALRVRRQVGAARVAGARADAPEKVVYLKDRFPNVRNLEAVSVRAPQFRLRVGG